MNAQAIVHGGLRLKTARRKPHQEARVGFSLLHLFVELFFFFQLLLMILFLELIHAFPREFLFGLLKPFTVANFALDSSHTFLMLIILLFLLLLNFVFDILAHFYLNPSLKGLLAFLTFAGAFHFLLNDRLCKSLLGVLDVELPQPLRKFLAPIPQLEGLSTSLGVGTHGLLSIALLSPRTLICPIFIVYRGRPLSLLQRETCLFRQLSIYLLEHQSLDLFEHVDRQLNS